MRKLGRPSRRWTVAILALLLVLAGSAATAGRNREFQIVDTQALLEGELTGVGVSADGALLPSPARAELFTGEVAYVWGLVPDRRGGVYAATGSDGRLFHIGRDGQADVLARTFEYELFALARGDEDRLYVSGAPNGSITLVRPDGETETVIDLPEGLVWDLLVSPDGDLYASTGEGGEVYRIAPDGEAQRVGRVPDAHVVSMAWWNGKLLCGTDGRGLLAALDPETGAAEILYDTAQEEVVAVLPTTDGRMIFAANGGPQAMGSDTGNGMFLPPIEVRPGGGNGGGGNGPRLYERTPNGLVRTVWRCPEQDILCLAEAPDGALLVGTGADGKLYGLDEGWRATLLLDLEVGQILALAAHAQQVFVGTGNNGSVVRMDYRSAREGTYTTDVLDAGLPSQWGRPDWVATGRGEVRAETRSGHIEEPGDLWSDWQPLEAGRTISPPARYLQGRLTLRCEADGDLRVSQLRIPYRGPNRAPQVADVEVASKWNEMMTNAGTGRPGTVRQNLPGGVQVDYTLDDTPAGNNQGHTSRTGLWSRSLRSATWKAQDPDRDELRFDLYLRPVEEDLRLPLKLDLEDQAYTWDAAAWPEGWYELEVVVDDEESNPPGEALTSHQVSAPFQIDNTPPRIHDLEVTAAEGRITLTGRAEDSLSRIVHLEYSINGEGWQPALPADRIFDDRSEAFRIEVPAADEDRPAAVIGVRVADEVGHVASARVRAATAP